MARHTLKILLQFKMSLIILGCFALTNTCIDVVQIILSLSSTRLRRGKLIMVLCVAKYSTNGFTCTREPYFVLNKNEKNLSSYIFCGKV